MRANSPLCHEFGSRTVIAQTCGRNAVQIPRANSCPEQRFAITRKGDAVGAIGPREDSAGAGNGVDWLSPDDGGGEEFDMDHGYVVEMAPGLGGAEIDGYNAVATFGRRVGYVGYALARWGVGGAEIEADVVEVLGGEVRKAVCLRCSREG